MKTELSKMYHHPTMDYKENMNLQGIKNAHKRIEKYIHKTPIITSNAIDQLIGRKVFFKCENFQKTGSFKVRGALNAIMNAIDTDPSLKGVVTHTSGNHGQGIAWAAREAGIKAAVVVPKDTSESKKSAIRGYGADLLLCELSPTARKDTCNQLSQERGYPHIPSSDHYDVISGQGTIALEFLQEVPHLDAILVPVSGGGMLAGIAVAAKAINPKIKIFAVSPKGKLLRQCIMTKERLWPNPPQFLDTMADAIRVQQCGHLTFPIICDLVEETVFEVDNKQMISAMKFAFERLKVVIEISSASGVAALFSDTMNHLDSNLKNIGVILCGGNADLEKIPWLNQ